MPIPITFALNLTLLEPVKLFSKVKFKLSLDIVADIIPIWLVDNWFVSVSMNDCAMNESLPLWETKVSTKFISLVLVLITFTKACNDSNLFVGTEIIFVVTPTWQVFMTDVKSIVPIDAVPTPITVLVKLDENNFKS